jgi:type IV pilus assembly protein PilN
MITLESQAKTVQSYFDFFGMDKMKPESKKTKDKLKNTSINDFTPYYIISDESQSIKSKESNKFKYNATPSDKDTVNKSIEEHICNISYMDIKIPTNNYDLDISNNAYNPKRSFLKTLIKIITLSISESDKIEQTYDFIMHYARLYDFKNEKLIGIDIKPNGLYLCQIGGFNGKKVLKNLAATHTDGRFLVQDIAKNCDEYASKLAKLLKENDITTKNVALSIPASNAIVKNINMPILKKGKIKKALTSEPLWNEIVGLNTKPSDYSIHYQMMSLNKKALTMNVLFIATKLSDINIYTNIVKKCGLNPVIVDVHSSAIKNVYYHKIKKTKNADSCVFLEFGLEENYAMIIHDGKTTFEQINVNQSHRMVFIDENFDEKTMDEFLTDYSKQVEEIINHHCSNSDNFYIKKIFVLSSVPNSPVIIEKLSQKLDDYSLSECDISGFMKINEHFIIPEEVAKQNLSSWAASIGMALNRMDIFGNKTANIDRPNMLPDAGKYAFIKKINYQLQVLAASAAVAITFVFTNLTIELNKRSNALSKELAMFDSTQQTYKDLLDNYNQLYSSDKDVTSIIETTSKATQSHKQILSVYQYLNLVILDNVWIRELSFTYPHTVKIIGGSDSDGSILEFIDLLNSGGQFEKVALKGMKEIRETNPETFMAETIKTFQLESIISKYLFPESNTKNLVAENTSHGS